jgi:tRNA nucleotidyltransferase (CCA-adding enzyme)
MKIEMPAAAKQIIEKLNKNGYEAYIVGGCVRDSLLGKTPHDWDITTSAMPEEVKTLFGRTIDTGIQHGTVTIMVKQEGYEVTTYRVDGEYRDHRRPESVTFTRSLEEDLKRRDFTINAMAYNDETGVVDLFHGIEDLKQGIIRCVGNPHDRFDEDALRILRAVRFAAQLGFQIEPETEAAITAHTAFLRDISAERIQVELTKLLLSQHTDRLEDAYRLGITAVILPEFDRMMETPQNNPHHIYDVGHHTLKVIEAVPATPVMRYAALLHDSGKPETKTTGEDGIDHFKGHNIASERIAGAVLRRLKLDNRTIRDVKKLVYWHDYGIGSDRITMKSFRRAMSKMGVEYFDQLVQIRRADMLAQSIYRREQKEAQLSSMQEMYRQTIEENQCLSLKDMDIKGTDLLALGVKPGPDMGRILNALLDKVLDDPTLNQREKLLRMAAGML